VLSLAIGSEPAATAVGPAVLGGVHPTFYEILEMSALLVGEARHVGVVTLAALRIKTGSPAKRAVRRSIGFGRVTAGMTPL
jgi:hypothetical protein